MGLFLGVSKAGVGGIFGYGHEFAIDLVSLSFKVIDLTCFVALLHPSHDRGGVLRCAPGGI